MDIETSGSYSIKSSETSVHLPLSKAGWFIDLRNTSGKPMTIMPQSDRESTETIEGSSIYVLAKDEHSQFAAVQIGEHSWDWKVIRRLD